MVLLGLTQLGLLGLLAAPLSRFATRPAVSAAARFVLRAPMSLYLGFLSAMLALVAVVYLPGPIVDGLSWLSRPRTLLAIGLLAVPAALVFWWFERHQGGVRRPRAAESPGRRTALLTRAAAALGIGYATLGVFGLALARFGDVAADADLLGLAALRDRRRQPGPARRHAARGHRRVRAARGRVHGSARASRDLVVKRLLPPVRARNKVAYATPTGGCVTLRQPRHAPCVLHMDQPSVP